MFRVPKHGDLGAWHVRSELQGEAQLVDVAVAEDEEDAVWVAQLEGDERARDADVCGAFVDDVAAEDEEAARGGEVEAEVVVVGGLRGGQVGGGDFLEEGGEAEPVAEVVEVSFDVGEVLDGLVGLRLDGVDLGEVEAVEQRVVGGGGGGVGGSHAWEERGLEKWASREEKS